LDFPAFISIGLEGLEDFFGYMECP
jgi:hypothetical protein